MTIFNFSYSTTVNPSLLFKNSLFHLEFNLTLFFTIIPAAFRLRYMTKLDEHFQLRLFKDC